MKLILKTFQIVDSIFKTGKMPSYEFEPFYEYKIERRNLLGLGLQEKHLSFLIPPTKETYFKVFKNVFYHKLNSPNFNELELKSFIFSTFEYNQRNYNNVKDCYDKLELILDEIKSKLYEKLEFNQSSNFFKMMNLINTLSLVFIGFNVLFSNFIFKDFSFFIIISLLLFIVVLLLNVNFNLIYKPLNIILGFIPFFRQRHRNEIVLDIIQLKEYIKSLKIEFEFEKDWLLIENSKPGLVMKEFLLMYNSIIEQFIGRKINITTANRTKIRLKCAKSMGFNLEEKPDKQGFKHTYEYYLGSDYHDQLKNISENTENDFYEKYHGFIFQYKNHKIKK